MAEEKLVYVVTDGGYETWRVIAAFEDYGAAVSFSTALDLNEPEALPWNPELPPIREGWRIYAVYMARNGQAIRARPDLKDALVADKTSLHFEPRRMSIESHGIWASHLRGHVVARSREHAIEIANKERVRLIASDEWPPDTISDYEMEIIEYVQRNGWRTVRVERLKDSSWEAVVHHAEFGTARASGDSEMGALAKVALSVHHLQ